MAYGRLVWDLGVGLRRLYTGLQAGAHRGLYREVIGHKELIGSFYIVGDLYGVLIGGFIGSL